MGWAAAAVHVWQAGCARNECNRSRRAPTQSNSVQHTACAARLGTSKGKTGPATAALHPTTACGCSCTAPAGATRQQHNTQHIQCSGAHPTASLAELRAPLAFSTTESCRKGEERQ